VAISQSQKVDFLYKKLGFTKTKTGLSVDGTISGTKKAGFGEQFASPLIIADGSVWNQSELIPTTPPASDTSIVKGYRVATALRMTVDPTVAGNRSFIAYTTFNNTSSARLTNWIDTQFGNDYVVKVYAGDPNSGGTLLPAGGSTGSDSWFFDYSSGVLQFHDTSIHSSINANGTNIYIVGYRYIGQTGVISIGDDTNFGDLTVNNNFRVVGLSTFVDAVNLSNNLSVAGITTLAGLSTVTGHTLFTRQLSVSGISTFNGALDVNSTSNFGDDVTLQTANSKNVVLDKSDDSLKFGDEVKAKFGDSDDLQIWHNANQGRSRINNLTGDFIIQSDSLLLRDYSQGHRYLKAVKDGQVELYHDNGIRFETTGIGVSVLAGTGNTATIAGPQFLILDPDGVGVNTGVVRIKGDLIVEGEQTIVKSTELEIADFIVGIASTATTDALADGAGFKIGPDNTLLYEHNSGTNPSLKSSENLNVATGKVYQIAETERLSASKLSLGTGTTIHAVGTNILSIGTGVAERVRISDDGINVVGISTFSSSIDANGNLDVAGISTFQGLIDANGLIEATAGENKIPSLYANYSNLPNAGSYHGMFAHVHATQKGYFAHGGAWYELVNRKLDGTVGTGTDSYNVGVITATQGDIGNGGLDVDGHTELDNVNISGVSTFAGNIDANGDLDVDGLTNLDDVIISGVTTTSNHILPDTNGTSVDLGASNKHFRNLYVSNLVTAPGGPGIIGPDLTIRNINATGIVTVAGSTDLNGSLDVDGQTDLDHTNIVGVATITGVNNFSLDLVGNENNNAIVFRRPTGGTGNTHGFRINHHTGGGNQIGGETYLSIDKVDKSAGTPTFAIAAFSDDGLHFLDSRKIHIGGPNSGQSDGDLQIYNKSNVSYLRIDDGNPLLISKGEGTENIAKFIPDGAVELYHDDDLRFSTAGYGATVFGTTETQKLNVTGISTVVGVGTFKDDVYIDKKLYVAGIEIGGPGSGIGIGTDITTRNLKVTGIATVTGNTDLNGNLDVDGYTELDDLNVSGVSTFAGDIYANSGTIQRASTGSKLIFNSSTETRFDHSSGSKVLLTFHNSGGFLGSIDAHAGAIVHYNGGNKTSAVFRNQGAVELYYDNAGTSTKRFQTRNTGAEVFGELDVTGAADIEGNLTVGVGGTTITTVVGAAASVGIGDASPSYMLDVAGAINSQTDVKVNGVSVTEQALNDAVAMAIALG